jgi:hypothetical protein
MNAKNAIFLSRVFNNCLQKKKQAYEKIIDCRIERVVSTQDLPRSDIKNINSG